MTHRNWGTYFKTRYLPEMRTVIPSNLDAVLSYNPFLLHQCERLRMDIATTKKIKEQIDIFVSKTAEWTSGSIRIIPQYVEVKGEFSFKNDGLALIGKIPRLGFIPDNIGLYPHLYQVLSSETDFIFVVQPPFSETGAFFGNGSAGFMLPTSVGLGGACICVLYSDTTPLWLFAMHEWLHNLDYVLFHVSHIPDKYECGHSTDACGAGPSDPYSFFPCPHCDGCDPDFAGCGLNNCGPGGDKAFYEHILRVHYNPTWRLTPNRCNNGVKDFDELFIDKGGVGPSKCPILKDQKPGKFHDGYCDHEVENVFNSPDCLGDLKLKSP